MQTDDNSLSVTDNNSTNNDAVNKTDTTKNIDIKINDEYKQLISQLTSEEYDSLKKSISESKGNVYPIILNKQGVILDGHHRYRACKESGIDPKIEIKEFSDPIYEKEFIITIHLNRRQLNFFQIAELGVKLEEIEKEKAKLRLSKGGIIGSNIRWKAKNTDDNDNISSNGVAPNGTTLSPIEEEEKGRTSDIIAKKIGMSSTTYYKARKIISEGPEEQKQRLRKGKDKIDKIYNRLQREKKKSETSNHSKQSSNHNDKVKSIKFKIPKERQTEINEEFNKCKEEVIVECHGYDKIVSIKADIFKENNQQSNPSTSNDQYNNNDTSNDDYTY